MSSIDPKALRTAFGSFMTGVTVVTTVDNNGNPLGFTANSFSSVSLDPPLLLVCPAKTLSTFDVFNQCEFFHVSVLAHNQQDVSNMFASSEEDRFAHVDWSKDQHGCPTISNALANFSCRRHNSIDAGDHIILLGQIEAFESREGHGLGYGPSGYFSLNMERKATELQSHSDNTQETIVVGALVEHCGKLLLEQSTDQHQYNLPQLEISNESPSFDAIEQYLEMQLGVGVNIGSVYSIFDHEQDQKSFIYYRVNIDDDLQPKGQFHPIDEAGKLQFSSQTSTDIVQRYIDERNKGNHKLYVGSQSQGKTHQVGRSS